MAQQTRTAGSIVEKPLRAVDRANGWNHRYRVRVTLADGRKIRDPRDFRTKSDAAAAIAAIKAKDAHGEAVFSTATGQTLFSDCYQKWHDDHAAQWGVKHRDSIESTWRIHVDPQFGKKAIGRIRHSDVQGFVTRLTAHRSPSTVLTAFSILKGVLTYAARDKAIPDASAIEAVKLPRKPKAKRPEDRHYLTMEQLVRVAANAGRFRVLVLLLGLVGLRFGEATALAVKDINIAERKISVRRDVVRTDHDGYVLQHKPKTDASIRDVAIPVILALLLAREMKGKAGTDLVFTAPSDGGYVREAKSGIKTRTNKTTGKSNTSASWWAVALDKAGVGQMPIHDLRHTAASLAISSGANVKVVQRMLGHKSAAMTLDTYADLFDKDAETVADRIGAQLESVMGSVPALQT